MSKWFTKEQLSLKRAPGTSLFSGAYWRQAARRLKDTRVLAATAMLMAVSIAVTILYIPLPNNLHIFFDYAPKALCAAVCGPVAALGAGFVVDVLGYLIRPFGAFFPGYTLGTMISLLIYALCLYGQKLTLGRVALARLAVNIINNICLNSLWSSMLYGKAFWVYLTGGILKNLLWWPSEVAVMVLVFRLVSPAMERYKLIPEQPKK